MEKQHIVIVGGGFAGVQAAKGARSVRPGADITVIDPAGAATMLPALPDLLSGRVRKQFLSRPHREIFDAGVRTIAGAAQAVDLEQRTVTTDEGKLSYDALVLAAGSVPSKTPPALQSIETYTVHSLDAAARFRSAVETRIGDEDPISILIVGAGYTGLETAVALRHGLSQTGPAQITVIDLAPSILPMVSDRSRERILNYLKNQEIDVRLNTGITEVLGSGASARVTLSDGSELSAPLVCWAAGMRATPIDVSPKTETTADGRFVTDESLGVPGYSGVFAAGDAAALMRNGSVLRRAVNFAYYSGRRAGQNAARVLSGIPPRPFTAVDLGWVIPLGDTSVGRVFGAFRVGGRPGLRMHYLMSGFRHFGGGYGGEFLRTAFHLRRQPEPPRSSIGKEQR